MPTFEFQCRKCKAISELRLDHGETYQWVQCPDCSSREMDLMNYDALDNKALKNILDKITLLEMRIDGLEKAVEEKAEELGLN